MYVLGANQIQSLVSMPLLVEALQKCFAGQILAPPRQICEMPGGSGDRLFLSMAAFDGDGSAAVKLASVFPDNSAIGLPTIQASIVLFSTTGTPLALLDGTAVTRLRTAAASALASRYLSRENCAHLLVMGTGALAPVMALAHAAVRPIERITIWGRSLERASEAAANVRSLIDSNIEVTVSRSIEKDIASADIITCATSSPTPILLGKWLKKGAFVDLVGSFSPVRRESDDDVILRSRIFVDTVDGALTEAGDLLDPIARNVIKKHNIEGDLFDLVSGRVKGRVFDHEITLFKSVGTAIEDLAAARMIVATAQRQLAR